VADIPLPPHRLRKHALPRYSPRGLREWWQEHKDKPLSPLGFAAFLGGPLVCVALLFKYGDFRCEGDLRDPGQLNGHGEIKATIDDSNHCSLTAWAAASESGNEFLVMLDSGAGASLWLSRGDAARIGIDVGSLKFDKRYQGVNGAAWSAYVTVARFRLGGLTLDNVPAYVISETDGVNQSLVGLPILQRLNYRVMDGQCVLSW
jgi:clan AA aspartic protease (TIGR02281 family)